MFQNFDIIQFLVTLPIVLISITIHEFAHCWTIDRMGDDTPRLANRLTLNPLAHLDLIGTIMIVLTFIIGRGVGWGKPAPLNPYNLRNPARDTMITAAAGPISNLLQMAAWASLGLLFMPLGMKHEIILMICITGVVVNASLAIFNLIPVYPLDGHHVLCYFFPALRPFISNPIWGILVFLLFFNGTVGLLHKVMDPAIKGVITACFWTVGWPRLEWLGW